MEKIYLYIEILLAQHDYVVVPNLGGFVVQTKTAEIFEDHIAPPVSTIGFNSLMSQSDGLLAIEIAKSEAISFRKAMELIDVEIEKLKNVLYSTGKFQFGNFGNLSLNPAGNITFKPGLNTEFLPENCGLNDIFICEINRKTKDIQKKITITLPASNFYKYAAACILFFSLIFISPKLNDIRNTNSADLLSTITFKTSTIKQTDSSVKLADSLHVESISQDLVSREIKNYHVIVASLPNKKSADTFCKFLIHGNFNEAHTLTPVRTYRVAIKSFSDLDEAISYMENLRKTDNRFQTAWVLCN